MGMADKPLYLTGRDGWAKTGDTFFIHNVKIDGATTIGGESRPLGKLLVSREIDGDKLIVLTSGKAITNQISRVDAADRASFPSEWRLDALPSTDPSRNATNVLTPANEPPPSEGDGFAPAGGDDF